MDTITILQNCINHITDKSLNLEELLLLVKKEYNNIHHSDDCINDKKDHFCVFTDGACESNGKKNARASYAIVFPNNREYDFSEKLLNNHTNNRAEYSAIIKAFENAFLIDPECKKTLYIYTDSELLINSVTKWMKGWKKNNWITAKKTPVLNKDLLIIIDNYNKQRNTVFKHVRAHTNRNDWESYWNNIVDLEAKKALHVDNKINIDNKLFIKSFNDINQSFNDSNQSDNKIKSKNILKQFGIK